MVDGLETRALVSIASKSTNSHCIVHLKALCVKNILNTLKMVLDQIVMVVNFGKSRILNSRIFTALRDEMGISYTTLLLHMEVRWFLEVRVFVHVFILH
jgi:hypothetical protein